LLFIQQDNTQTSMWVDSVRSREELSSSLRGALFSISLPRGILCKTERGWKVQTLLHQARVGRLAKCWNNCYKKY
jgi:hypothetical protein